MSFDPQGLNVASCQLILFYLDFFFSFRRLTVFELSNYHANFV